LITRLKQALKALCGAVAATALFAIMALTLVDVGGRKLVSASVPGSLEFTELLMVAVTFSGLPLVSFRGEHVVFDSLDPWLSPAARRVQGLLVELLCAAMLGGVAWLMWGKAADMSQYGDTTAQLKIPQGPFVYLMSGLCGLTSLVHLVLVFGPALHRHIGVDEPT
jgi:TRAP-type C4-dicarboxylate transport system permease small subunit